MPDWDGDNKSNDIIAKINQYTQLILEDTISEDQLVWVKDS